MKKLSSVLVCLAGFFSQLDAQLENLGPLLNSSYTELAPYITPDGSKIFFLRENHPQNTLPGETQDVWWCKLENDSVASPAKHLAYPFNTIEFNCINFQSADGQLRMIKGNFDDYGNYLKSGYSYMTLGAEGWSDPSPIEIKGYSKMAKGLFEAMCLAPGGNTMILAFSEKRMHKGGELYLSKRINDNTWSKPIKLNGTRDGDFAPFIASDNKTMYFASTGRGGFGDADIFMTKRLDDSWLNWSEPVNMGANVNTADWDGYFKVSPGGRYAYLVSAVNGNSDLYRLPLFSDDKEKEVVVQSSKPEPVIIVEGIVKDAETNQPLGAVLDYTNLTTDVIEGIGRSSVVDGSYKIVLPYGINFSISAHLRGYYSENVNLDLSHYGEFAILKRDILLRPIKAEAVIRLNNIFFGTAQADLLPASQNELNGLIEIMNSHPKMVIEIRGHTDDQGGTELNRILSENRAKAVVAYLISKGIPAERLSARGFGEKSPATENETPEGRAINRRVEFKIVSLD